MIIKRPITEKAVPPPPPGARPEPARRTLRGRREQVLGELRTLLPADVEVEISYRILGDGDG